jgi:putative pyrroloquinoline-quinone binding quinoprotein
MPHRSLVFGVVLAVALGLAATSEAAPEPTVHRKGEPLPPCSVGSSGLDGWQTRESGTGASRVDECGQIHGVVEPLAAGVPRTGSTAPSTGPTIDSMSVHNGYGTFYPSGGLSPLGSAGTYYLSDGTTWNSGAGSYRLTAAGLDHVEVLGTTVRYHLTAPTDSVLYEQTDFDSGDHSAQGTLKAAGPLVLEASIGSTQAVLRGVALVASNEITWYGEPRFNFYSALVGSVVPFAVTITNYSGGWNETTFDQSFSYSTSGMVWFTGSISSPALQALEITGPAQIPDRTTVTYEAWATYEGGTRRAVTNLASWSVSPAGLASVSGGLVTVGALDTEQADLLLGATFTSDGQTRDAELHVLCRADLHAESSSSWPMFQANAGHTGYLPLSLDPAAFAFDWSVNLGNGSPLNPVTGAGGRVFGTLRVYFGAGPQMFALDARDGHTMWTKSYTAFSVNPPSCGYGNVYVQTGNHGSDTWLHAYDAATGSVVFDAPHSAQWERYYAPTLFDGKVYVDGGYYGGMYGFDALSGRNLWFLGLEQYDEWTPAVDDAYAYSYVGEYRPGLYVVNRADGTLAFQIPDLNFEWDGWSMRAAPVLGGRSNVLAIHDGRLLSFDLQGRSIGWEIQSRFEGQPSVSKGIVYAIDAGSLIALDEVTHAEIWAWTPPRGVLVGTLIVTDSHVLASTGEETYAVDLTTHDDVWSYPAGGHLALADGRLYIASSVGVLTAIEAPSSQSLEATLDMAPKILNLHGHSPLVVRIQPIGFDAASIDPSSVRLEGTIVPEVKSAKIGDQDGNGASELLLRFSLESLRGGLEAGMQKLTVTGSLVTGETFSGSGEIRVIDPPAAPAAVVPNPLNPEGVLRFHVSREGPVAVGLYDVRGRLIRSLMERSSLAVGLHELRIDGRDGNGLALGSGVYYFRVESVDGVERGRVVVLK